MSAQELLLNDVDSLDESTDYNLVDDEHRGSISVDLRLYPSDFDRPQRRPTDWRIRYFGPLTEGSLRGSTITLTVAALGAGVLSLPFVLAKTGIVVGLVILVAAALLASYSLELLVECGHHSGCRSYSDLTRTIYGKSAQKVVEILMIFYCFGAVTAYVIVIASCLTSMANALEITGFFEHNTVRVIAFELILIVPLTFLPTLSSLRYVSFLSVASLLYVAIAACYRNFEPFDKPNTDDTIDLAILDLDIFSAFSIAVFAFTSHPNLFGVYQRN